MVNTMRTITAIGCVCLFLYGNQAFGVMEPAASAGVSGEVSLRETVVPTAIHDAAQGSIRIAGELPQSAENRVLVRVTDDRGGTASATVTVREGRFTCRYPEDFPGAPPLRAGFLFLHAAASGGDSSNKSTQAEATLIVHDSSDKSLPEFPSAFTNDLLDHDGRTDRESREWPVIRALVNTYMHSRAAEICRVGQRDFDLAREADLQFFKNNLTQYEFDFRDREWAEPLGHRKRRTFWQAVWNTWFNSSNNNPIDGNNGNNAPSNFVPYAFANDFCDLLMLYLYRLDLDRVLDDNLDAICREGLENMMAMQHRQATNFALRDAAGRQHTYTAGAFRYGMFENGEFMTEGNGWFHRPEHNDYTHGGVFNARSLWCIGEGLQRCHQDEIGNSLKETLALGVRYCLFDALAHGYAKKTAAGNTYWYDAGEMGYLLLGMLCGCTVVPELVIESPGTGERATLAELTARGLDALVEMQQPHGQWQAYANKDPMVIAALADGVTVLHGHPHAARWKEAAVKATDSWLAARVDPEEYAAPLVHFGALRREPASMSFLWDWKADDPGRPFIFFYMSGHWIHALARVYDVTGDVRYRARAEAMVSYLCGANPWRVRLLNELGGVYNWVEDRNGDGIEDHLKQDMYPESTAFCQIGINHLLRAIQRREKIR